ncbi:ogr/Delta-like zinc finger family protein [Phytohalomonas tamaricis]|uniref:ogr/Delta-like zinc finger family protein n=1 Tax=Phytohalomonas tamaricis TaxID=2081032 RepID=UPI000D0B9901|nr:ogr/Delta-like zinc finger family protein [Phytohalomonas tamaricis]
MKSQMRNKCPECGAYARIRKSEQMDERGLYKVGVLDCMDADCGWRGTFDFTITKTLVSSMKTAKRGKA